MAHQISVTAIILDTLHQALITHTVYTYTITDWGNPAQLQVLVWSLLVEVIFTGITAFVVQSFLTIRIWRLSGRNVYITGTAATLVLGGLLSCIIYLSRAFKYKTLEGLANVKAESMSVNVIGAAADVLISGTLCTLLNFSRTGFHKSDAIINKLIIFTVNTGLLTSLCALASLISILVAGNTFVYIAFFFCLGRLYTNSLLATLNARKTIRGTGSSEVETTSVSLRDLANKRTSQHKHISVKIDTTQAYHPSHSQNNDKHEQITQLPDNSVLTYDSEHNDEEIMKKGLH